MLIPPWCRAAALFLLVAFVPAFAQTPAPPEERGAARENPFKVAPKEGAKFRRDYRRHFRAWCERVLVTPAKARLASTRFEQEAGQFIDTAMEEYAADDPMSTPAELARQGAKLDKAGCDEPLTLFLAAHCAVKADGELSGEPVAKHALERALPGAKIDRDSSMLVVLIAWETYGLKNLPRDARRPLDQDAVGALLRAISQDKIFADEDSAILVRMLCADPGEDHFKRVHERYASICDS